MSDSATRYISYLCPFRCGRPHEAGFVDPGEARRHIAGVHGQNRKTLEWKYWPHPADVYEMYGVTGPIRKEY